MECKYFEKLKEYNYGDLIFESKYWFILLAPDQNNLGTCVVALKRDEGDLAGLNSEEWEELSKIVRNLQTALKKSFNSTMFNWGCLMNSSYLKNPPNPHVHWHFIPRYRNKKSFEGIIFEDPCFGFSTMKSQKKSRKIPEYVRRKIIEKIRVNLEFNEIN